MLKAWQTYLSMFNLRLNENLPNKSVIECVLCIVATSTKTSGPPCSNSHVWFVQWEFMSLFIIRVLFLVIGWKKIFLLFRISLSLACRLTFGIFGGTSLILGANFVMHPSPVGAGSSTDWTSKVNWVSYDEADTLCAQITGKKRERQAQLWGNLSETFGSHYFW